MSVVLTSASSMYLKASTINVSAKPITVAAWVKSDSLTLSQGILSITNNSNEFLLLQLRGSFDGDYVGALEYATAWKLALTTTAYTADNWHHICGIFKSDTSRSIYIDGSDSSENTDSQNVNFALFDQILIGTHKTVSGAHFSGKLAHCCIWDTELSEANITSLVAGTSPSDIASDNLVDFWPLIFDGKNLVNTNHLTGYNNPTYDSTDNPTVLFNYPQQNLTAIRRLVVAGNDTIYYENI